MEIFFCKLKQGFGDNLAVICRPVNKNQSPDDNFF